MALRRLPLTLALVGACALLSVAPGSAITGGQFDGSAHPYVGFADNGVEACSGTLLSPTVMLTAAHCFSGSTSVFGTNAATGAPIVRISFDPNLINTPRSERVWFFGSFYADPQFRLGGGGIPDLDTHDLALVVLTADGCSVPSGQHGSCGPIPPGTTLGQYGVLPGQNLVASLGMNAPVEIAGFGIQNFQHGGGPCADSCVPRPGDAFTRFSAQTTLITSNNSISNSFVKLHANSGGVCFGDSGGPVILAGTRTILGVNAFVTNDLCDGISYAYRVDIASALAWIASTAAAHGASL